MRVAAKPIAPTQDGEAAWVNFSPSRHFISAEDQARRCLMCRRLIPAGERYFASRTENFDNVYRFHKGCAETFAEHIFL